MELPLLRTDAGISYTLENRDGQLYVNAVGDVYAMLEANKAMFNENAGWSWSRCMRRAASVPSVLRLKWLWEEGWDAWKAEHQEMLDKKLNDPDWRHLRTAPGRI